jgi:hypothetical protein
MRWLALLGLVFVACSSENTADHDAGVSADVSAVPDARADAEPFADAETFPDAATSEDAETFPDADTAADAGGPAPGFGTITGTCGVLDTELTDSSSHFFVNHIDFAEDGYDKEDYDRLTAGGREIIDDGNAGGSSIMSEVFSYELLERCEQARLLKTETEVLYTDPMSKLTDLLVEIDGMKVGVSVTRAVAFPFDDPYPPERALSLLNDKLSDILISTANVDPADAWVKQILYIIAYADAHVAVIEDALLMVEPAVRADTVIMVSVSDGEDAFIY